MAELRRGLEFVGQEVRQERVVAREVLAEQEGD